MNKTHKVISAFRLCRIRTYNSWLGVAGDTINFDRLAYLRRVTLADTPEVVRRHKINMKHKIHLEP